jgi:hypothetical protein
MPTYVYETTIPTKPLRRFEVKQSMRDEPLRVDPETGESVRRVISGGYGVHVLVDQPAHRLVLSVAPAAGLWLSLPSSEQGRRWSRGRCEQKAPAES